MLFFCFLWSRNYSYNLLSFVAKLQKFPFLKILSLTVLLNFQSNVKKPYPFFFHLKTKNYKTWETTTLNEKTKKRAITLAKHNSW